MILYTVGLSTRQNMYKMMMWLLLTLLSCGGLGGYFLQQQYAAKSAEFRIFYRDVTVKLAQLDAIMPLLPSGPYSREVRSLFPHIVQWRTYPVTEPHRSIVIATGGRYWLHVDGRALLIDLNVVVDRVSETIPFQQIAVVWQGQPVFTRGAAEGGEYWQWQKAIVSPSQPFVLRAGDNPAWGALPWLLILSPGPLWGAVLYLLHQYRINRRRRDMADLRAHYAELTRLNTLGELTAGIVHELNQPLTAILSYTQTALRLLLQQRTEPVPPLLEAAVVQIKRTDALLQQFRQKLVSEQADYQPIVLASLWQRVIMLLDNEIRRHKVAVSSAMAADLPALIAPPLWVEQILHNIAHNALQAQQHNAAGTAWIRLEAVPENDGILITLSDGGPGLSEAALQQVFMPFFTTRPHGIGLGMALADTLVQRLNGTIEAANIPGQGACFTLWLPRAHQE
ncbi:sensor histidine kinase [Pantoea sp. 1.19]|uniref:sensor histidine kinase n=1 Tax=Pantoea sp. 1.19 TaxID=1925589 RepID=UPI000A884DD8|nr:ATP-binding protein [Pantoea sp. 1.19]